ncbi:hypothetical protein [Legionella impletisoli]|uniref:Uncharacterized protein n=1 Tax=Legionella impletisoli TaxID=343510 RepID=A0A917JUW4_9GAMM|nr:hypothetical protein [Legionella impletisoli]GGI83395.1 hypothetical protein GCM10007966_09950 [Legionella impletisoli]
MKRFMTGVAALALLVGTAFADTNEISKHYKTVTLQTSDGTKIHAVISQDEFDKLKDKDLSKGVSVELRCPYEANGCS